MSISPLKSIFKIGAQPSEAPEVVTRTKSLKKRLSSALKRLSFNRPSSSSKRLSSNRPLSKRISDVSSPKFSIEKDITKGYVRMKPVPPRIRIPMDIRVQEWIKEAEEAAKEEVYVCMDSKNTNIQESKKV